MKEVARINFIQGEYINNKEEKGEEANKLAKKIEGNGFKSIVRETDPKKPESSYGANPAFIVMAEEKPREKGTL